jgi:hypothetical protein
MITNIPQEEFFVEKFLQPALFAVLLWFITAIIYTSKKVLEKSALVDTNAKIVVVQTKKIIVFGKV